MDRILNIQKNLNRRIILITFLYAFILILNPYVEGLNIILLDIPFSYTAINILFVIIIILKEIDYREKPPSIWYLFIFWVIYLLNIIIVYIALINVFFLPVTDVCDYLCETTYCTIQYDYSIKFKIYLIEQQLNITLNHMGISPTKRQFILATLNTDYLTLLFYEKYDMTLNTIRKYINYSILFTSNAYDIKNNIYDSFENYMQLTTTSYQVFLLIRNILLIMFFCKFIYIHIPMFLINTLFKAHIIESIRDEFALRNIDLVGITDQFIFEIVLIVLKQENAWNVLLLNF